MQSESSRFVIFSSLRLDSKPEHRIKNYIFHEKYHFLIFKFECESRADLCRYLSVNLDSKLIFKVLLIKGFQNVVRSLIHFSKVNIRRRTSKLEILASPSHSPDSESINRKLFINYA
mgnify:CR=1 FL=1